MKNLINLAARGKSSFGIAFTEENVSDLEPGETATMGVLLLGTHVERFVANLCFWSKAQYEHQWRNALESILTQADRSALITSMHDPTSAKFIEWWPMWREGKEIVFHSQLLFLSDLSEPFDISRPARHIGPRRSQNEDGGETSEWRIQADAIRSFLAAR